MKKSPPTLVRREFLPPASIMSQYMSPNRSCSVSRSQSRNNDPVINTNGMVDMLLEGFDISNVNPNEIPYLLISLKNRKAQILEIPDYDLARKIDCLINEVSLIKYQKHADLHNQVKLGSIESKIEATKLKLDILVSEYQKTKNNYDNAYHKAKENLEKKQQIELDKLDAKFSQDPPPHFRKLSNDVLQIIYQERSLRATGEYEKAKAYREEAEAIGVFQLYQQQVNWEKQWQQNRQRLMEKHQNQMKIAEDRHSQKWYSIEIEFMKEKQHIESVIAQLESQLLSEKKKNYKGQLSKSGVHSNHLIISACLTPTKNDRKQENFS